MNAMKTGTITMGLEDAMKGSLKKMAGKGSRSLANMIEVMIREYCKVRGVNIADETNN